MRDPFAGYDAWLERPYQDMIDESDRFYEWAEEEGFDMDDPDQFKDAEDAYQDYIASLEEDNALAQYEAYMDRLEMEADEYDYAEYDYDKGW